jgi:alpha-L-fucosidase
MKLMKRLKRGRRLCVAAASLCVLPTAFGTMAASGDDNPARPTPQQAAWQDLELGLFIHFDIPVFAEASYDWRKRQVLDATLYNPAKLDTDQWMEAAEGMGARYAVFVAKHCTGFISWQSAAYPYGVRQSRWRDGKGDVMRDFVDSCRKFKIEPGVYCSVSANGYLGVDNPGLTDWGKGTNKVKQAEYVRTAEQLAEELWGNYGPLNYVWFDGGALPVSQGGPDLVPILKRLQPNAVAFQGPEGLPAGLTRWVGNEDGVAGYPCWATVRKLNEEGAGHPEGKYWQPGECDVPLRGDLWFWLPNTETRIRSLENLMKIYYGSVGRNCNLIVNANIDRDGLVPAADLKRFKEFGEEIKRRFGKSLAETTGRGATVELAMPQPTTIDHVILMEQITEGERIREYVVEGLAGSEWVALCSGQSIGHKRIQQFPATAVGKVRLRALKFAAEPIIRKLAVYQVGKPPR